MARSIMRFDPFAGVEVLRRDAFNDRLFRALRNPPTIDVYIDDDGSTFVVESHLPKFGEDDISVNVDSGQLVVQAERHEREEDKQKKYVIKESSSSFYRSIALPDQADLDHITADFDDGLLTVRVPLNQSEAPRKIEIGRES